MRIKLVNESTDEWYYKISEDDSNSLLDDVIRSKNSEKFTDMEVGIINDVISITKKGNISNKHFSLSGSGKVLYWSGIKIYKLVDDYYLIKYCIPGIDYHNDYYKCDQFEGLLKCIRYLKKSDSELFEEFSDSKMKYIKLFEAFESSSYELCSSDYLLDMDREDFNDDELIYLKKFISGLGLRYKLEIKELTSECNVITGEIFGYFSITIRKWVDEWYRVSTTKRFVRSHKHNYYKCDQLNGIEELIKDKIK